jgi:hypothetical protein
MKKSAASQDQSASDLITNRIAELGDWRGQTLARMRALIKETDPEVVEEWKWMGTPVWSHDGIICTGESYKKVVKLTFAKGAFLTDPARLFNSSLDGNVRRAIDIQEGERVNEPALKALIRQAIALNGARATKPAKKATSKLPAKALTPSKSKPEKTATRVQAPLARTATAAKSKSPKVATQAKSKLPKSAPATKPSLTKKPKS